MSKSCWTHTMECDGDCGAQIEIRLRESKRDMTLRASAAIGWKAVKTGRSYEFFCPFCQARAKRMVRA